MGKPNAQQYWQLANYAPHGTVTFNDLIKPEFQPIYTQTHEAISYALDNVIDNVIRLMRLQQGSIYRYNHNWNDTPLPWKDTFSAFHGIDIASLFGNFVTSEPNFMHFAWDANNAASRQAPSNRFIKHFSTFARTGAPSQLFDGQTHWPDWTNFTCCAKRMVFDNTSYMSSADNFFFWPLRRALFHVNATSVEAQLHDHDTFIHLGDSTRARVFKTPPRVGNLCLSAWHGPLRCPSRGGQLQPKQTEEETQR